MYAARRLIRLSLRVRRVVAALLLGLRVAGDEVDHPMAGAVEARDPAGVEGDVGIGRVLRHPRPPARVIRVRSPSCQACPSRSALRPPGR